MRPEREDHMIEVDNLQGDEITLYCARGTGD
jgi:hypothetical protein